MADGGRGALLLAVLLVTPLWVAANEPEWPARKFEVVKAVPDLREITNLDPVDAAAFAWAGGPAEGRPTSAELGALLEEIGRRYRRAGHSAPRLMPIVDLDGVPTYRVFMFPYSSWVMTRASTKTASYRSVCGDIPWGEATTYVFIDQEAGAEGTRARPRYLFPVAHEVMHALSDADGLGESCQDRAYTVTEGIPDAASMYFYKLLEPWYLGWVTTNRSSVGLRSYALELNYGDETERSQKNALEERSGYGTSSFWFFVAERFGGLKVFPHFTGRFLAKDASTADVVKWIDEGLNSLPGLQPPRNADRNAPDEAPRPNPGLYEVYPAFVSEFASYGGSRYMAYRGTWFQSDVEARRVWYEEAFNGCKRYTLSPTAKIAHIPMLIGRNSARCFQIELKDFQGEVSTQVEVIGERLDLLDQLHLGWAWKEGPKQIENCYREREKLNSRWPPCVFKAFMDPGPTVGTYSRTWTQEFIDFGVGGSAKAERTYIISNIAPQPWKTKTYFDLEIKVAANVATRNGEPAEPIGPLPHRRRSSPSRPSSDRTPAPAAPQAATTGAASPSGASGGGTLFGDLGKEALYGLRTDPVIRDGAPMGFTLQAYEPEGIESDAVSEAGVYAVLLHQLDYGETGPVYGTVDLSRPSPDGRALIVSSGLCEGSVDRPIGDVLQSDEDAFQVRLDTNLCRADDPRIIQCENGCPVVDHLAADVHMAFGWRQFASTAPAHIVTPGIRRYVATMPDTLAEALRAGAGTALPETDGAGDGSVPSTGAAAIVPDCACTCEEQETALAELEAMKEGFRAGADGREALRKAGVLQSCFGTCQREYLICNFEADERRKAAERQAALEARAEAAAACDCSCAGVRKMLESLEAIQKQAAPGADIDHEELNFLSTCFTECSDEVLACRLAE